MKASTLNKATQVARQTVAIPLPSETFNDVQASFDDRTNSQAREFVGIVFDYEDNIRELEGTMLDRATAWVKATYGATCPNKPTVTAMTGKTGSIITESLLQGVTGAYAVKQYRLAIIAVFGALPVSDNPESVRKAAQREAEKASKPAKVDEPKKRVATATDEVGQFIARVGFDAVLIEMAKILSTEKATAKAAMLCTDLLRAIHA
jgi:hypothetical protein